MEPADDGDVETLTLTIVVEPTDPLMDSQMENQMAHLIATQRVVLSMVKKMKPLMVFMTQRVGNLWVRDDRCFC